jgi:transglutaminase-like putative cysteine protease
MISMEMEICHTTRYEFSEAVFLEPHALRFQPRADGGQLPLEFSLDIDPLPAGMSAALDAAGNTVTHVWFDGVHRSLTINAHAVVLMLRENPFDFLADVSRSRLPVFYAAEADALRPYLYRDAHALGEPDVVAILGARMRDAARGELAPLLTCLNHTIYDRFQAIRREEPGVWSPERTWREKCGACRDLAMFFMDVCRSMGIAARFVSGYEQMESNFSGEELHAWAEAYIPGAGWRGYDPSRGLAVAQHHIAVAAAATPSGAAPVTGTYRGSGMTAQVEAAVRVDRRMPVLA